MEIVSVILIITGLCLFEAISSIDNAIINAEVLSTMGERARRWFLLYEVPATLTAEHAYMEGTFSGKAAAVWKLG